MASDKNPVLDYLQEKTAAGFGGIGQAVGRAAKSPFGQRAGEAAAAAGAVGAVGGGIALANKLYDAATKARDFRAVLESDPDLAAQHQEDPAFARRVNAAFSTVRRFNPAFSKDPFVAATIVRQLAENPNSSGQVAMELAKTRQAADGPMVMGNGMFDTAQRAATLKGKEAPPPRGGGRGYGPIDNG